MLVAAVTSTMQADDASTFQPPRQVSPLQRLKHRSAASRWRQLSDGWWRPDELVEPTTEEDTSPATKAAPPPLRFLPLTPIEPPAATEQSADTLSPRSVKPQPAPPGVSQQEPQKPLPKTAKPDASYRGLRKINEILPYHDYAPEASKVAPGEKPSMPDEVRISETEYQDRQMPERQFTWQASNLYHNPLYFEDPGLERYGHTHHQLVQPFVSVGRFGLQLVGLPYQMTIDPIRKKMYTLGWYRPGEVVPYQYEQVPWNLEAAIREGGVLTGLFFLIP